MFRTAFVAAAISLIALTACGDGDEAALTATAPPPSHNDSTVVPVTPAAKPESVPQTARPVEQTATLGLIVRRANAEPEPNGTRRLLDASCQDNIVVFETSEETIYAVFGALDETTGAAVPCDRFWDSKSQQVFMAEQVAIVLEVTEARFRVLIETLEGAQAEFTFDGIWVE